ncbi:MAG: AmmeMemoRadiSam system radical SAM enzyme, partial [Candidatus Eremiobacterota bacterium]
IASWIADNAGRDTLWHVTRFYPHLKLSRLGPTPVKTLEKARQIGLNKGLHYVYLGNVPGHDGENTWCHACGKLLIERYGMQVCKNLVRENKCPYCGNEIPGRFS